MSRKGPHYQRGDGIASYHHADDTFVGHELLAEIERHDGQYQVERKEKQEISDAKQHVIPVEKDFFGHGISYLSKSIFFCSASLREIY